MERKGREAKSREEKGRRGKGREQGKGTQRARKGREGKGREGKGNRKRKQKKIKGSKRKTEIDKKALTTASSSGASRTMMASLRSVIQYKSAFSCNRYIISASYLGQPAELRICEPDRARESPFPFCSCEELRGVSGDCGTSFFSS